MDDIQEFDFSLNLLSGLIWRFNNAENLEALLRNRQTFFDEQNQQFWENWIRDVFSLRTANEFGLSIWSIILNLPLFTTGEQSPDDYPAFGFDSDSSRNFGNGNFATSQNEITNLNVEQKRLLLRLRYFQLVSTCTPPEINEFMNSLFGDRQVYVLDGNDMTMTYVFAQIPDSRLFYVLQNFDILPRPSGVEVELLIAPFRSWGFDDYHQNFDNGNFFGN